MTPGHHLGHGVMTTDPQREYAAALEQYRRAMWRIIEAKRHIPPSQRDLRRMQQRAERERLAAIPPSPEVLRMIEESRVSLMDWNRAKMRHDIEQALMNRQTK
jgi:hypothetical protein